MLSLSLLMASSLCLPLNAAPDMPFIQETHERFIFGDHKDANDVRAVAVDGDGNVFAATKKGVFALPRATRTEPVKCGDTGIAFDVCSDREGHIWAGAWNGVYRVSLTGAEKVEGIDSPIAAVCPIADGIAAVGPDGLWQLHGENVDFDPLPCSRGIRAAAFDSKEGLWIATGMGLTRVTADGDTLYQSEKEILSADVAGVAYDAKGALWAGGLGGITLYEDGKRAGQITTKEGLPSAYVQCLACAPDGTMWIGTPLGVARFDGKAWSLLHGRRWLAGDDVRDVAFDGDGTAWVATEAGISAIKRANMTLAGKAAYFEDLCMARHIRKPWIVERCKLPEPGDTSHFKPEDDDNDGQYTAMYCVMESFRWAATKDPVAREHATKAFETLRFLQTVTDTQGFFARTVVPTHWTEMHDRGDTLDKEEAAEKRIDDPRYKPVANRWRHSNDGQWLWKGDTSSDEATGHFYGFGLYFDLAADDAMKEVVREHVRKVMDYIIDGDYTLKDIDGTHTRWGVWTPERLNSDPDWAAERGINSVEILSYLKTAYHVTGDEKYQGEYLRLLNEEHLKENVRHAKTYALSWCTRIDDELLAMAFTALLRYETDAELLALYRESLDWWYQGIRADQSPFFDFVYASLAGKEPVLDNCMPYLREAPLDLIDWTMDNTKREDIQLVRAPLIEPLQTSRLLPPSERGVIRWDKNPWAALQGGQGRNEQAPTTWLLPYWMGRYYGYIEPARSAP